MSNPATGQTSNPGSEPPPIPPALICACLALAVLHVVLFPAAWFNHQWIIDEAGRGIPTDFINVWSAGVFAREGHAALAYDWGIQKDLQVRILGQTYPGNFAWHYPPPFLFVAAALASVPYVTAYMIWPLISFAPYAIMMRAIVGRAFGWLLALAFPVVLVNTHIGQNGFLTAALVGGTLYLLPVRPVLAGVCLGLLSYKPQYGILFPLVLIAASQWTAFASAAITAIALALVATAAFGFEAWQAWAHWLPMASQAFLSEGRAPWGKMQSIFATVRYLGGPEHLAWMLQYAMTGLVAVALVVLWRSRVRYSLKAAALATGTLLATPYLFLYDVMILAVPVAFLVRIGLREGFLSLELPMLGAAAALLFIYPAVGAPTGFLATLIVAAMIARRCEIFSRCSKILRPLPPHPA
ncbi:MAG: DUF2029 domain-containing protein [Bradyrhizobiaceae bacterium]|nr:MAG: DUF2029 domain-containing protein [Bradyrhizobiaceae bacterium]